MSRRRAAALVALLAGCGPPAAGPLRNEGAGAGTVIAFGDSLTAGFRMPREESYPAQLSRALGRPILNQGVSGDTTEDALARLERDVLARDPRVVLVWLGANDMARGLPAERQFANLEAIVRRIQQKGARVVLVGVTGYGGVLSDHEYAARYRALAERTGAVHVPDPLADVRGRPELMRDRYHPNAAGNEAIARRLAATAGDAIRR